MEHQTLSDLDVFNFVHAFWFVVYCGGGCVIFPIQKFVAVQIASCF